MSEALQLKKITLRLLVVTKVAMYQMIQWLPKAANPSVKNYRIIVGAASYTVNRELRKAQPSDCLRE